MFYGLAVGARAAGVTYICTLYSLIKCVFRQTKQTSSTIILLLSDNYIQCIIKLRKIGHILNYFQVKFNAPHPLPVIEEVRRPDTKYLPTPLYKQKCSIC